MWDFRVLRWFCWVFKRNSIFFFLVDVSVCFPKNHCRRATCSPHTLQHLLSQVFFKRPFDRCESIRHWTFELPIYRIMGYAEHLLIWWMTFSMPSLEKCPVRSLAHVLLCVSIYMCISVYVLSRASCLHEVVVIFSFANIFPILRMVFFFCFRFHLLCQGFESLLGPICLF